MTSDERTDTPNPGSDTSGAGLAIRDTPGWNEFDDIDHPGRDEIRTTTVVLITDDVPRRHLVETWDHPHRERDYVNGVVTATVQDIINRLSHPGRRIRVTRLETARNVDLG